jgi:hypothetical protein
MTPLFTETPVSVSYGQESIISLPGIGGLLHHYSGGSAGAGSGGCQEREGLETCPAAFCV